jgi:hypothetical protein
MFIKKLFQHGCGTIEKLYILKMQWHFYLKKDWWDTGIGMVMVGATRGQHLPLFYIWDSLLSIPLQGALKPSWQDKRRTCGYP